MGPRMSKVAASPAYTISVVWCIQVVNLCKLMITIDYSGLVSTSSTGSFCKSYTQKDFTNETMAQWASASSSGKAQETKMLKACLLSHKQS